MLNSKLNSWKESSLIKLLLKNIQLNRNSNISEIVTLKWFELKLWLQVTIELKSSVCKSYFPKFNDRIISHHIYSCNHQLTHMFFELHQFYRYNFTERDLFAEINLNLIWVGTQFDSSTNEASQSSNYYLFVGLNFSLIWARTQFDILTNEAKCPSQVELKLQFLRSLNLKII